MTELVLHHYAGSPFSHKVRLVLGSKGLAWRSVLVPVMLPKPDVVALTGGYRRTPFLQVGADIYCDSALMCRVIEARAPQPTLWPAATNGLADIVAQWADSALFWTAVPYTLQPAGAQHIFQGASPEFLSAFRADRAAMTTGMRRPTTVDARAQVTTYFERLEQMLADGRRHLLGAAACIADFSVAQSIWYLHRAPPIAAELAPYPKLLAWYGRMAAIGEGRPTPMTSAEAIALCAATSTHAPCAVEPGSGFEAGAAVRVNASDYAADVVVGTLVGLTRDAVTIERDDPRAGRVHVHFPRIGFQLQAAD